MSCGTTTRMPRRPHRSEEHTSELQSPCNLVCRLLLEKKKKRALLMLVPRATHNLSGRGSLTPPRDAPRAPGDARLPCWCRRAPRCVALFFFFNDTATTEIYTLSLHDALPI